MNENLFKLAKTVTDYISVEIIRNRVTGEMVLRTEFKFANTLYVIERQEGEEVQSFLDALTELKGAVEDIEVEILLDQDEKESQDE